MLAVQVQYFNYLEDVRHNKVTEQQGAKSLEIASFNADTQRMSAQEQARHNRASENISWSTLEETSRHNREQENIGYMQAQASQTQAAAAVQSARASQLSAQASMTSAQAQARNVELAQQKWETSGYYVEQTQRLLNQAQIDYYKAQASTGALGAVGNLLRGAASAYGAMGSQFDPNYGLVVFNK